jgi:hypothetical protein
MLRLPTGRLLNWMCVLWEMVGVVEYFGWTKKKGSSLVEVWTMACTSTADVAVAGDADGPTVPAAAAAHVIDT